MTAGAVTLFLCGDVMLGRGVDQILPRPGAPALKESYIRDARAYVELAEAANGPVPWPVPPAWPWGDALRVLDGAAVDVRVVNLETSVTGDGEFAPGKEVHYRMHPGNVPCLAAARPDVCVLANNHVLDFGRRGLEDTLDVLAGAGLRVAGAGRDAEEAWRPAVVDVDGRHRVVVVAFGTESSGIPPDWAATRDRPGVAFVPEPTYEAAAAITGRVREAVRPGDVVVASVHWGSNWGYAVGREQVRFAHALVDGGVDVVHGHSSHHPRPLEPYRGGLVLYGCGDFIDDYEGITGYEQFRDDLRPLYLVTVEPGSDRPPAVRIVPLQAWRMSLRHASREDGEWLRATLDRVSRGFGARVGLDPDGTLVVKSR
ncbi:CapA family protein [Streptomyces sp. WAC05374]|uniref:CapA family protein n=1 Tax=Streptomyces sp. WAC05374 TaxID=2487420 RepID=UPI000F85D83F|nr:CapA family protein [Streptomyces sp. WAC05374]RST05323.1 CapA family protein [Streptomyces sp. WAC05374]TDF46978.1 CapA family protein [Streptomyces sp. WAC05374]TDF57233.1 CapA family protein [Streptomyces sp. WAC05374]TDF61336.1 CapA family protein [Streptomyces sp. WAC05374]